MDVAVFAHRIQFAFTVMFHYLFPILTMGLGFFIALLSTLEILKNDPRYGAAARFWAKIFTINFALGVVTGIPLEFEFGTNWSRFSAYGGGVFGQTLPLEGVYAFFLESGFLGLFLFGHGKVSRGVHWLAGMGVAVGSLLSGYFIVATNAWMQHPVGYAVDANGTLRLTSFWEVMLNPFAGWQYLHTINGALLTAAYAIGAAGAYYVLSGRHPEFGRLSLKIAVIAGVILSLTQAFPTGDMNSRNVTDYQPVKLAAMEGLLTTQPNAPLAIIGMPDPATARLIDPLYVPGLLSYLAYGNSRASVKGLDAYPKDVLPPIELTYYSYHIMVGLGTLFIAQMLLGLFLLWRRKLESSRWFLWTLMLAIPFPYIANEAGWTATEVGRQPWLVYGLLKTPAGTSPTVASGETIFTMLGFAGIYALLAFLFVFLVGRIIVQGPDEASSH